MEAQGSQAEMTQLADTLQKGNSEAACPVDSLSNIGEACQQCVKKDKRLEVLEKENLRLKKLVSDCKKDGNSNGTNDFSNQRKKCMCKLSLSLLEIKITRLFQFV